MDYLSDENLNEGDYEPVYTIGHAARKLGVAVPTLRMYEKAGLLLPCRTSTNRRLYSRNDIQLIEIIIDLIRNHHLNLEALKRFAALIPCWRIKKCPESTYLSCSAYTHPTNPCWYIHDVKCTKAQRECRTCDVYRNAPRVIQNPKQLLKQYQILSEKNNAT